MYPAVAKTLKSSFFVFCWVTINLFSAPEILAARVKHFPTIDDALAAMIRCVPLPIAILGIKKRIETVVLSRWKISTKEIRIIIVLALLSTLQPISVK